MAPFDLLMSFVFGLMLSFSAREALRHERYLNKYLLISLLWLSIFFIPPLMIIYVGFTDWQMMYLTESLSFKIYFAPVFLWSLFFFLALGFFLSHFLIKTERERFAIPIILIVIFFLLIFFFITFDRFFYVGSYLEWKNKMATPLLSSDLFFIITFIGFFVTLSFLLLFIRFLRGRVFF